MAPARFWDLGKKLPQHDRDDALHDARVVLAERLKHVKECGRAQHALEKVMEAAFGGYAPRPAEVAIYP